MTKRFLVTLQFATTKNYEDNLQTLISLIKETPDKSVVLAPEVCLTDFDYVNFEEAAAFSMQAINALLPLSKNRIIILTLIEKRDNKKFFNVAKVLHKEEIVHEQCKNELFILGEETKYFTSAKNDKPCIFEVDGLKLGLLICFELRFKKYWCDLEGADIILVPARWGKNRAENFKVLTEALAIINQCYVMGADATNEDCTSMSGIVSPFGKAHRNGNALCLIHEYDKQELRKMRRYLDVGIK
ncbi:carbon-nitrogen hydrolase family protein [Sulfurimonas sp. MAG313]|nr:carbon-nitrogen hydrolase family protein [Sulfurimonas sp. MAG313]MDF1880961.1 carbon-nitrogen hydrolase family protein [Sulfurimonas sp. MAG313]